MCGRVERIRTLIQKQHKQHWISGSNGWLLGKSKRRSRNNSFECQALLYKRCKRRRWVSLSRLSDLCFPSILAWEVSHFPWVLKVPCVLNRAFHCDPNFWLHYHKAKFNILKPSEEVYLTELFEQVRSPPFSHPQSAFYYVQFIKLVSLLKF